MRALFETTVQRILADHVTSERVIAAEQQPLQADLWNVFSEAGVPIALASEALGGTGASWADLCGVVIACGEYSLPLPLPETLLGNWLLGLAGLPAVDGSISFSAGELTALQASAQQDISCEAGKVSGKLVDVPWGGQTDYLLAISGGEAPQLLLLKGSDAVVLQHKTNTAGEPRVDLALKGIEPVAVGTLPAAVPADILLLGGALLRAAQITGAMQKVQQLAVEYANERVQFGKPIGRFQAVQHQLALVAEQTSLSRSATETAYALMAKAFPVDDEQGLQTFDAQLIAQAVTAINAAKICSAEAASVGAAYSHGVHGAIGFTHEYSLHIATRRLWSWRSEFGSANYWSVRLGQEVCAVGADNFWASVVNGRF